LFFNENGAMRLSLVPAIMSSAATGMTGRSELQERRSHSGPPGSAIIAAVHAVGGTGPA
jgi:hypothetical protein